MLFCFFRLMLCGWDSHSPQQLLDPMCGGGTLAVEAALLAADTAPGLIRYADSSGSVPCALSWLDLQHAEQQWGDALAAAAARDMRRAGPVGGVRIFASDIHAGSVAMAQAAARQAGVQDWVQFCCGDVRDLRPPLSATAGTLIVTNPPWDVRLNEGAADSWRRLGELVRRVSSSINGE